MLECPGAFDVDFRMKPEVSMSDRVIQARHIIGIRDTDLYADGLDEWIRDALKRMSFWDMIAESKKFRKSK